MGNLVVGDKSYEISRLRDLQPSHDVERLPYSLRVLLENTLRQGDDDAVAAVAGWDPGARPSREIGFRPARVLLQDFTGVPRDRRPRRDAATRSRRSAAIRARSIRCSPPSS